MQISAPFVLDAEERREGEWVGRVRVDGHVLLSGSKAATQEQALQTARECLAAHLEMLFAGAGENADEQRTETYASVVELSAGIVLRQASGWLLLGAHVHDEHITATYRRVSDDGPDPQR